MSDPAAVRSVLWPSVLAAFGVLLAGCGPDGEALPPPGGVWTDDDDEDGPSCTGDPGEPRVELIVDDESHEPVLDGAVYEIARRYQGEITVFAPIWFGGLPGGEVLDEFELSFTDEDGEELGLRRTSEAQLPCEDERTVAVHSLEIFFDYVRQPEEFDGIRGTLRVECQVRDTGQVLTDEVQAELAHVPKER